MARLIQFGNPKIQNRQNTFYTPRISVNQPRLIKFTLVFVDEILHKYSISLKKITTFVLNDNQPTQLSILANQEISKYQKMKGIEDCHFHFFNFLGDEVSNYEPTTELYYVSTQNNINWIYEKRFSYQLKQIKKLEGLSTSQKPSNTMGSMSQIPSLRKLDQILPQNSFRTRCLQKEIQSLESVSENAFLNSRQSSDPFIITNFKLRTKPTTQSFSIQQRSKIEIKSPRKIHFDKEEHDFLENIQKCEEELNEYLEKMKSKLSKDNDQVDKIIQFYEQVSYPTPKSRALEAKQIYTSNYISAALEKILSKTNIEDQTHKSYYSTTKRVLSRTPQLSLLNIPNLQQKYRLNRNQLYQFYSLYKVLHLITAYQQQQQIQIKGKQGQKHKQNETLGITYEVYRNGIETIQDQSENIARGIFDIIDNRCSGFLDWEQFIFLMSSVQAKTREQRIDLFIKIADSDHNGVLSFQEVVKLSLQTLQKFIHTDDSKFLEEMSQFFSRIIFDSVGIQYDSDIEFNQLKEIITQGHPNSDLLCMFCGAE